MSMTTVTESHVDKTCPAQSHLMPQRQRQRGWSEIADGDNHIGNTQFQINQTCNTAQRSAEVAQQLVNLVVCEKLNAVR